VERPVLEKKSFGSPNRQYKGPSRISLLGLDVFITIDLVELTENLDVADFM
jgi:hypothetical protein